MQTRLCLPLMPNHLTLAGECKMMTMISAIKNFFTPVSQQQWVENYLAKSESLYDLERRQKELSKKGIY